MTVAEAIQKALDFIATTVAGASWCTGCPGREVYRDLKRAQLTLSLRELRQEIIDHD
jgi:hypothetical protein